MKARNVIISLLLVLGLLAFIFIRIRNEPKKKLTLNRNPSRIEYSQYALCRMECYNINANLVSLVLRKGYIIKQKKGRTCPVFRCDMITKQNEHIFIFIEQCGTVAKVFDCYDAKAGAPCNCVDEGNSPVSYLNSNR